MYCNINDAFNQPYYDTQGHTQTQQHAPIPPSFNLKKENLGEFIDDKKYIDHDFYVTAFVNNPLDKYLYRHLCECNICKDKLKNNRGMPNMLNTLNMPNMLNISEGFSESTQIFGYTITAKELCVILIICFIAIFIIDLVARLMKSN